MPADYLFSCNLPHADSLPYLTFSSSREARSLCVQSPNVVPQPRTPAACLDPGHVVNPFLSWRTSPPAGSAPAGLITHRFLPVVLLGFDIMTK